MPSAFAITSLHVCRKAGERKDGKVVTAADIEIVPAGQITDLSDDDFKAFEKAGAVRKPSKVDRAMAEDGEDLEAVEAVAGKATAATQVRTAR
ncbi:hypothetical protein [Methylobacterium sp. J-090]|uniref:hypothetical protein n=1 Tax=Methylobacterium sp. J-090 TaxID=2836666 RepID=UPI001FBAB022|nr:hypothetical protein [Methylobacterium sp. J-090]MCJ2080744.1 hypothetical protein [Methylobacterium sp. J-090]